MVFKRGKSVRIEVNSLNYDVHLVKIAFNPTQLRVLQCKVTLYRIRKINTCYFE